VVGCRSATERGPATSIGCMFGGELADWAMPARQVIRANTFPRPWKIPRKFRVTLARKHRWQYTAVAGSRDGEAQIAEIQRIWAAFQSLQN